MYSARRQRWITDVADGPSRLLKNSVQQFSSSASNISGGTMGGSLEQHEVLSAQFGSAWGGAEVPRSPCLPLGSGHSCQRAHPDQVVHGGRNGEHPPDPRHAAMPSLAQQPHGFHPPKDLFHAFPFPLTHGIAGMTSGASINGAGAPGRMLRHMRGHPQLAQFADEVAGIIILVSPQGHPL